MDFNNNSNNQNQNGKPSGYPYTPPARIPGSGLSNTAMVLGIISLLTALMMTVYFPFIFGSLAIVFAILSKGKAKKLVNPAKTGIVLGIAGLVVNVVIIISSFAYVFSNPDILRQTAQVYDNMSEQIYGMPSEDVLGHSMEDIVDNLLEQLN